MKTLLQTFEDEEFEKLKKKKKNYKLNWHDFIMLLDKLVDKK